MSQTHKRDEFALKLMFDNCTSTIDFGKSQMWDTFKWCMTLQFTLLGISLLKAVEFGNILFTIPIIIGSIAYFIVFNHATGLESSRIHLENIRDKIGGVVLEEYPPDQNRISSKKKFSDVYLRGIAATSIVCSALIFISGFTKNAGS